MGLLFQKIIDTNIDELKLPFHVKRDWYRDMERATKSNYINYIKFLYDIVKFRPGIIILDVGCGIGSDIAELSWLGANCIGIEVDLKCIRLLNHIRRNNRLSLTCIHCDAHFFPFRNSFIDVIMSNQFFEHASNLDQCLNEQIRALRKGGRLIIRQGNLLSPLSLYTLLIKYPKRTNGKYGGIKWLFTKGKVIENIYGTGWTGKDEDSHSRLWWWRKMKRYSYYLQIEEFSSYIERKIGKIYGRIFGDILIIAKKKNQSSYIK